MTGAFEIKGGADEFEAAVIAVVVDHVREQETSRGRKTDEGDRRLPAWVRAINPERYPERSAHPRPGS